MADETTLPVILPPEVQAKLDRGEPMTVACPAGEPVQDRQTGRQGVFCKIERQPLTLAGSPLAVACFCCHEYHNCPSWQAAVDKDPAVERQYKATEQRKQDRLTEDQIEHGVRFDDREERDFAAWMEGEIKLQASSDYPHEEEPARGQSSILLPPGYEAGKGEGNGTD